LKKTDGRYGLLEIAITRIERISRKRAREQGDQIGRVLSPSGIFFNLFNFCDIFLVARIFWGHSFLGKSLSVDLSKIFGNIGYTGGDYYMPLGIFSLQHLVILFGSAS
jgi:hypothetical protein